MEGSMPQVPARRMTTPRPAQRSVLAFVAVAFALLVVAIVAMTPEEAAAPRTSTVEDGGLAWDDISIVIEDEGLATVDASVELDDAAFPVADGREDRFVMYQLAGGRFDTDEHVDDQVAERVLGFDADDRIQLVPTEDAARAVADATPRSGEYTLSLDGSVEYAGIPEGTWELRAYVVDRSGSWDGPVAVRTVEVR